VTVPAVDQPLDRRHRRLSPLTPLVRSGILLVAALASTWEDVLHGDLGPVGWIFLTMLVAGTAYGTASWLRTRYWIESDELRVDTGVVTRQSRRIRVDRLQGIDIVQPLVARLFGLAELKMDVAGGRAREGSLAFLPLREAEDLREVLLSRRDAVRAGRSGSVVDPAGREQVIARLDLPTLVLSLLLSLETIGFVLVAAATWATLMASGHLRGVAAVLPVLIGFAFAQLRKLSAYYAFTVSSSPAAADAGLLVRRGLFELNAQTISLARVQGVVVSEPWLWRGFGWASLEVALAGQPGSEGAGRPTASTVMPVAPRAAVLALARTLLAASGAPDLDAVVLTPPPLRARWAAPVAWRFMATGVGPELVVSRRGVLVRRTHAVPHARVQSLQLHQGPWQRRLGLADLQVDSPPGPVAVRGRHRDAAEVRAVLDREVALTRRARLSAR
jgi:putative membrane protein